MKSKNKVTQAVLVLVAIVFSFFIVYPVILVFSASFSTDANISKYGYTFLPKEISFDAYKYIFKNPGAILNAYKVTAIFSVVATVVGTLLMSLCAYPLTKSDLKGRNAINFYLYFTMLFNGGLVPTYILNTQYLHLNNTIWIYIIPGLMSPWYVFMLRTFFKDIPNEICESALIDGAGEYRILFQMIIPLSKPVLATVLLMTFLGKWNEWYTALLYINDSKLYSLQYLLQMMMRNIEATLNVANDSGGAISLDISKIPTESVRMAMAVVVAGPVLVIFPFFQKYFVKGLTVGSVKG